jgi:hypothetical protein
MRLINEIFKVYIDDFLYTIWRVPLLWVPYGQGHLNSMIYYRIFLIP